MSKSRVERAPECSLDKLKLVLVKYDLFEENRLKSRKDPVWQQICTETGRSNPVSVCINFSKDRLGQQS